MLQAIVVDLVVLAAAAWLLWTFAPGSLRARLTRRRAPAAYDAALQADGLAGRPARAAAPDCACGDDAGCH